VTLKRSMWLQRADLSPSGRLRRKPTAVPIGRYAEPSTAREFHRLRTLLVARGRRKKVEVSPRRSSPVGRSLSARAAHRDNARITRVQFQGPLVFPLGRGPIPLIGRGHGSRRLHQILASQFATHLETNYRVSLESYQPPFSSRLAPSLLAPAAGCVRRTGAGASRDKSASYRWQRRA
jgi:hypothetical protein